MMIRRECIVGELVAAIWPGMADERQVLLAAPDVYELVSGIVAEAASLTGVAVLCCSHLGSRAWAAMPERMYDQFRELSEARQVDLLRGAPVVEAPIEEPAEAPKGSAHFHGAVVV
ncbi:MAG TPA: hypothetical protein VGM37_16150 [Armatimonadota bacterium]|jgi:hypothetical protein